MLQTSTASYASAPCHDDDDMFEKESKSVDSSLANDSTMFADEEQFRRLEQPTVAVSRPSSLNTTSLPTNGQKSVPALRTNSGATTLPPFINSPSSPLDSLRTWSSNTLLYARHLVTERFGRRGSSSSAPVDSETALRVVALREQQRHYAHLLQMTTSLTGQMEQIVKTQRALGGAFGELSQCGGDVALGEQFACSTDVMRLMSKQGESLLASLSVFRQSISTLCNTTIEDTLTTVKGCENARIKYDAYKSRVDSLRAASRDSSQLQRLRETEAAFELHKQKYDRIQGDLVIKLKFLEENKVIVCQKHLYLLHKAFTAYISGNLQGVDDILRRCHFSGHAIISNAERPSVKPVVTAE